MSPTDQVGTGMLVSQRYTSPECVNLAKRWLSQCIKEHPACKPSEQFDVPTRLIDVGSSFEQPRLVETSSCGVGRISFEWLALSHCWGNERPLVTTTTNLQAHQISIEFSSFPKTFQDAILITRSLGIRYLWIDSLCIIQNSKEDWQQESGRMATVYAGAIATIAAMSAKDSRGGCFVPKRCWGEAAFVEVDLGRGGPSSIFVRQRAPDHGLGDGIQPLSDQPLADRAWVQQERVLSTRIFMYSDLELLFECRTAIFCECGRYPYQMKIGHRHGEIGRGTNSHPGDSLGMFRFWNSVVRDYTRRELTYDGDILPAISAVAALVQEKTGDEYLAGLWKSELPVALLWSRDWRPRYHIDEDQFSLLKAQLELPRPLHNAHPILKAVSHRPIGDRAPTWSWASVAGASTTWNGPSIMNLASGHFNELLYPATVVRSVCYPSSSNKTGAVSGGDLELEGHIHEVRLFAHKLSQRTLLHSCQIADLKCGQDHDHADGCLSRNTADWAVLDVPLSPANAASLATLRVWRFLVGFFAPMGADCPTPLMDLSGEHELVSVKEGYATHTTHYFLLLVEKLEPRNVACTLHDQDDTKCYERIGLLGLNSPRGMIYNPGARAKVKIT